MARVLVIDDEPDLRAMVRAFLRGAGYQVETAENLASARAALQTGPFEVIVCDLVLPDGQGTELVEEVHRSDPSIKIILLTGAPSLDSAAQAIRVGAFDYLVKPASRQQVLTAVAMAAQARDLEEERTKAAAQTRAQVTELEQMVAEHTEELVASRRRYEFAAEAGKTGVWDVDIRTRTLHVDPVLKALLGVAPDATDTVEAWLGRIHEECRAEAIEGVKAMFASGASRYEATICVCHEDGSERWFLARGQLIRDGAGTPVRMIGTGTDITDQKRDEQDVKTLADAALELAGLGEDESLWEFLCRRLSALAPDSIIGVSSLDAGKRTFTAEKISGIAPSKRHTVEALLGTMIQGISASYEKPDQLDDLIGTRLQRIDGGLHAILLERFPRWPCERIEKELGICGAYSMGLRRGDVLLGAVSLLARHATHFSAPLVEALVNQTSIEMERRQAEAARLEAERQLRESESLHQEQLVRIAEAERASIQRDIHDSVCQQLSAIGFTADSVAEDIADDPRGAASGAEQICELATKALEQAQIITRGLEPLPDERGALYDALQELAADISNVYGVQCDFRGDDAMFTADSKVTTQLFLIAREAAVNAAKHASAGSIVIQLERTGTSLSVRVSDDGKGIEAAARGKGRGMETMKERTRTIGAALDVGRRKGGGTEVACHLVMPGTGQS